MKLLEYVLSHEEYRPVAYCTRCRESVMSTPIGWGCKCYLNGDMPGDLAIGYNTRICASGVNKSEARQIVVNRLQYLAAELDEHDWFAKLYVERQAAILDLAYALGLDRLLRMDNMINAIRYGDYDAAASAIRVSRVERRHRARVADAVEVMRSGKFTSAKLESQCDPA